MMARKLRPATALTAALLSILSTSAFAAESVAIPAQTVDAALHAKLPADIQKSGVMTSVNNGSFPPYEIVTGNNTLDGASSDLADALAGVLGVKIEHASVSGMSGILSGMAAGRYQLAMGPIGDYPDRQAKNDFIDFVKEYVVFAVHKGNPQNINSLDDTCGKRIAVMAGGSAEQVIRLVLPAAWVKGPLKEMHWEVLVTARALENTTYVVAVGECGERNIGNSMVVDPLGVAIARAAEAPALVFAELDKARLEHARKVLPVLDNRRFDVPQLRSDKF